MDRGCEHLRLLGKTELTISKRHHLGGEEEGTIHLRNLESRAIRVIRITRLMNEVRSLWNSPELVVVRRILPNHYRIWPEICTIHALTKPSEGLEDQFDVCTEIQGQNPRQVIQRIG